MIPTLGQAAPPMPDAVGFDRIFWLTIGAIFLFTIVGSLIRRLSKDKCLGFLDGYHVTVLSEKRPTLWGDLAVTSDGFELIFDAPRTTERGIEKWGALAYADDYPACIALARTIHALTDAQRQARERQVRRSFNPGRFRRGLRMARNLLNTIRDALSRAIGLAVGRISRGGVVGAVVRNQSADVAQLGGSVVGLAANAYEPLLERHIGRPVVLEIAGPPGSDAPATEWPGYLMDYTAQFVAVFNIDHEPVERFEVNLSDPAAVDAHAGVKVESRGGFSTIRCTGPEALVIRRSRCGDTACDFAVVLLPGTAVRLNAGADMVLEVERTRRLDLVCPRSRSRVRYTGGGRGTGRTNWFGVAPEVGGDGAGSGGRRRRRGITSGAPRDTGRVLQ